MENVLTHVPMELTQEKITFSVNAVILYALHAMDHKLTNVTDVSEELYLMIIATLAMKNGMYKDTLQIKLLSNKLIHDDND